MGHRDVCSLEPGSSVGRAGDDDPILTDDLVARLPALNSFVSGRQDGTSPGLQ